VDHGSELDKAEVGQEREYACWAELPQTSHPKTLEDRICRQS
jgi:hypothetical protein